MASCLVLGEVSDNQLLHFKSLHDVGYTLTFSTDNPVIKKFQQTQQCSFDNLSPHDINNLFNYKPTVTNNLRTIYYSQSYWDGNAIDIEKFKRLYSKCSIDWLKQFIDLSYRYTVFIAIETGINILKEESSVRFKEIANLETMKFITEVDLALKSIIQSGNRSIYGYNHKVLLIGSGGREHAIADKLSESISVSKIFVAPGNGGTAAGNEKIVNIDIKYDEIQKLVDFSVTENITLVVVGPEQPLVDGLVDKIIACNIACFGPVAGAAIIESSKAWSKSFMVRHGVNTAKFQSFLKYEDACDYIKSIDYRVVIKASGLAAGKGVILPVTKDEELSAISYIMNDKAFGEAGSEIVIEEFIDGEEVSLLAFTDGLTVKLMPPAQDHKRIFDNDEGPNTGGMGAYAPSTLLTPRLKNECETIINKVIKGMASEGRKYIGVIYGGFMIPKNNIDDRGPSVLEFNARFGDPETQVLLPLLDSDLFNIFMSCSRGTLSETPIVWKDNMSACTVVCASPGYPNEYPKDIPIYGLDKNFVNATIYQAGTKIVNNCILTNGGRVLSVTGIGKGLQSAVESAYTAIKSIRFNGMHYRKDIAKRGLESPIRLGVLGSTRGTDMQAIINAIESKELNATISIVISNKTNAGILERASSHNIKHVSISSKGLSRETFDDEVSKFLYEEGVDLVLLIGYMRILSKKFVSSWKGKCLNVHPSLLPDFAGGMDLQVHEAVINAKKSISGCTIHFVTDEVDGGPILLQEKCAVEVNETPESLKAKVQVLEGIAFIKAIKLFHESIKKNEIFQLETITYQSAGVDIDAGDALVKAISPYCKETRRSGCDAELGGFGGLFDLSLSGYDSSETVLVSGTDGVGTKLKIAQALGKHDTIGIDLVAMCVNDILVCGAEPLFFLDYYATGSLNVTEATQVVKGIAEGCKQAGCALIGGETAEMAGMYAKGEYDLAGFSVGAVKRSHILPRNICQGDILIGLPSSGVHSNGYSLVRKCVEKSGLSWTDQAPFLTDGNLTLGESFLTPTRIYVSTLLPLIKQGYIKGMAHITGGGLLDNLPRIVPNNLAAIIDLNKSGWVLPSIFKWLNKIANLPQSELFRTFNCGIGMVLVIDANDLETIEVLLKMKNEEYYIIGALHERIDRPEQVIII